MANSKTFVVVAAMTISSVASGAVIYAYNQHRSDYFRVERIIDGDTIDVSQDGETTRVRLLNIDTPEVGRNGQPSECLAEEATNFLAERIPVGTSVKLSYDQERTDKYGRTLAGVYATGSLVNAEIARVGLGKPVVYQPNDRFYPKVLEASRAPNKKKAGIFGVSDVSCMTFDEEFLKSYEAIQSAVAATSLDVDTYDGLDTLDVLLLSLAERAKLLHYDSDKVTEYQRLTYGEELDESIAKLRDKIRDKKAWSEDQRKEKKKADDAESKRQAEISQEAARGARAQGQSQTGGNTAPNGGSTSTSTLNHPNDTSPGGSAGLGVDTYNGCRAYGGSYAPNAVDAQGRPYTKIDCATKTPI